VLPQNPGNSQMANSTASIDTRRFARRAIIPVTFGCVIRRVSLTAEKNCGDSRSWMGPRITVELEMDIHWMISTPFRWLTTDVGGVRTRMGSWRARHIWGQISRNRRNLTGRDANGGNSNQITSHRPVWKLNFVSRVGGVLGFCSSLDTCEF